jgi:signal transduction histidine kinase
VTTLEGVGHTFWRGRAPLVIAATIPLAVLLAVPWRATELPAIPGFSPLWLALLIGCDLLTVLLLLGQYRAGGSARLLGLSVAYVWSAAAAIQIAVSVPGIFSTSPTFAATFNSLQWLWVSRHVVPPVLIALALAPWPARLERRFDAPEGRAIRATVSWVAVAAISLLFAAVVANAPERLPTITAGNANRLDTFGITAIAILNMVAVAVSVWGVAKRRSSRGVESWAVVASVAFLGDVWLTALYEDRFSLAYYLARFLGLAASAFVMLAILRESSKLQVRTSDTARRLEEQNAQLLEATKLRDHLTAVVSHDMRTPLAGLQGYLEMLRDDDLESALAKRMLDRSWMLTRRLTLLTEDLLAAATLEHGDLVVSPEVVDVNQQLGECATCFPDLDLELDCPVGLSAYADPLRLQQILANLVRNAQKHGAEPVLIAAAPDPALPGGVTIRVSDAGPGVPATFVPRLFDRYSQDIATATGGSGLGLSVVRDLVSAHRGTVGYDAGINAFVFTLPPRRPAEDVASSGRPGGSRPLHDPDPLRTEPGEHAGRGRPEA